MDKMEEDTRSLSSSTCSSYLCEHCGVEISKTLYYQHKKLYYSIATQKRLRNEDIERTKPSDNDLAAVSKDDEFTFSDDSNHCNLEEGMLLSEVDR